MKTHLPPTQSFGNTGIPVSPIGIGGWLGDLVERNATAAISDDTWSELEEFRAHMGTPSARVRANRAA